MRLIYEFFYRWAPRPKREVMLNRALSYAMAWGKHWCSSTQTRMQGRFPFLTASELDSIDSEAREAMNFGQKRAYDAVKSSNHFVDVSVWRAGVLERFVWMNERNLKACLNQGKYYAWKDGIAEAHQDFSNIPADPDVKPHGPVNLDLERPL